GEAPPARRFLGTVTPWMILAALAVVELFAYAQLSVNFGLEQQLGIDPSSPVYSLARFFMAPFGAALTLSIAGIGYWIVDSWEQSRGPRALSRTARSLTKARDALDTLIERAPRAVTLTEEALSEADSLVSRKLGALGSNPSEQPLASSLAMLVAS